MPSSVMSAKRTLAFSVQAVTGCAWGLQAGDALREIRDRGLVRHGQLTSFYKHLVGSARTAQIYIELSKARAVLEETRRALRFSASPPPSESNLVTDQSSEAPRRTSPRKSRLGCAICNSTPHDGDNNGQ